MADSDVAAQGITAEELARKAALMGRIGACWSPSFSPGGRRVALVADLSGVPQVWTVDATGGWPELVTPLTDQVQSVAWSPDGQWIAFQLAPGGGLNTQVYLVRPDGRELHCITPGGRTNNWLGRWSPDGAALIIASSLRSPAVMDAYLYDLQSGALKLAAKIDGTGTLTDVSRDRSKAIVYRMQNRSDDNLYLLDLASGAETLLTPHEGPGTFLEGQFSPDGKTVYLSSNAGREMIAFGRIKLDDAGQPGPIELMAARDDADLQEFEISNDGQHATLIWNAAGLSELATVDLETGVVKHGPQLPGEIVTGINYSSDGRTLAMTVMGAGAPRDIWVLERSAGTFTQITRSPHPGVDLTTLVRPELVRFKAHDGLELSAWLYQPQNYVAPGPLVISFHGGPEAQERPFFSTTYQALLGAGIAVLAPNIRGSSGFGKTFVNLDNGALRFDAVKDIEACLDYVIGNGIAAKERIGIMGGSYGGYMTMAGLTQYPDRFAAGATLCGVVNFETFFAQTEPWMAAISKIEYGDPDTEADLLRRLSPIHQIDRVTAATMVLHGGNDTNVPVVEAEQVVENLQRRGVPVEYVLFPDEGHGFRKIPNRIKADVSLVRWFSEHLRA